jgi:hypothetical protein
MVEKVQRLALKKETLRELYLKSGNWCAFPGCKKRLFNIKGVFVAQICHIEAAEEGGQRFNPLQTNEQRRHFSNLMLMCYDHHKERDDVSKFNVDRMRRMKADHELMFSDVVEKMLLTVQDYTDLSLPCFAKNLRQLDKVLGWSNTEDQLEETLKDLNEVVSRLAKIPLPSRNLFLILVKRATRARFGADYLVTSVPEIQQATNLATHELRDCFSILDRNGFTFEADRDDLGGEMVDISNTKNLWAVWKDLREFCEKRAIDLSLLVINLDFSVLDEAGTS